MMEKKTADVSVIAANYNNGRYLADFIGSVEASTLLPKELIIVDDGSSDESLAILEGFSNLPYLIVIKFPENKGFTTALNAALEVATGNFIMRADPDDIFSPERIEKQLQYLTEHPDIDVLGSNAFYFQDQNGKIVITSNFPVTHAAITAAYRKGEHGILHATAVVKAEVFKKYRYQAVYPGEDYELFSRMVKDGHQFNNLSLPLYKVRVHVNSSSTNIRYQAIKQTYGFRDEIFGTRTKGLKIYMYYIYIKNYRAYQIERNIIFKYFHLFISALAYPAKAWQRIRKLFAAI